MRVPAMPRFILNCGAPEHREWGGYRLTPNGTSVEPHLDMAEWFGGTL